MKKNMFYNFKSLLIIIAIGMLTHKIGFLPWWGFLIPILIFGIVISFLKWDVSYFRMGFLSGFIIWLGGNLYYDIKYSGDIINKIALLLTVPKIVVFLISGIIGGLLTGLAFYTGKHILALQQDTNISEM